jgi:hypothetical protein
MLIIDRPFKLSGVRYPEPVCVPFRLPGVRYPAPAPETATIASQKKREYYATHPQARRRHPGRGKHTDASDALRQIWAELPPGAFTVRDLTAGLIRRGLPRSLTAVRWFIYTRLRAGQAALVAKALGPKRPWIYKKINTKLTHGPTETKP